MLVSTGRPAGISWALTGTGAAFIGAQSLLTNGRVADACRMQWLSGAPGTGQNLVLTGTFPGSSPANRISARCCALLMPANSTAAVQLPAGVNVQFSGKLSGGNVALGGNSLTANTVLLPNGGVAIWCVFPAVTIDTLVVTIPNNASGATWATSSQCTFDLGEIWVGKGADFGVQQDFTDNLEGGLLQRRSHNNQPWPLQVQPYRTITANLNDMPESVAIGPNAAQDDWETVYYALSTSAASVVILEYLNAGKSVAGGGAPPPVIDGTTINTQRLNRTAMLGVLEQPIKMTQDKNIYLTSTFMFGESPP